MNGNKRGYALIFGLAMTAATLGPVAQAAPPAPIDHQPIATLRDTLKASGQVRVAQGIADQVARDPDTQKMFVAKEPLMVTLNSQSGEWTISLLNDRLVGSTLLIGDGFQRPTSSDGASLPTFDPAKAAGLQPSLKGFDPTYYPDEIKRVVKQFGFQRVFTGRVMATTQPEFKQAITPSFADVLVIPSTGEFMVLVVDQYGTCGKIAFGGTFSEKP